MRCYLSWVCTFKHATKNLDIKVDVQNGALGFRGITNNGGASLIQSTFSFIIVIIVINYQFSMTTMSVTVRVCIWALGFLKLEAFVFVCLMQSFSHILWIRRCLIIFSLASENENFICIQGLCNSNFKLCICNGGIYHIKVKLIV
jgi:hypothetical protein